MYNKHRYSNFVDINAGLSDVLDVLIIFKKQVMHKIEFNSAYLTANGTVCYTCFTKYV